MNKIAGSELFSFLRSLKMTSKEATLTLAVLEKTCSKETDLISVQQIKDALELVRKVIPEENRNGPMWGAD